MKFVFYIKTDSLIWQICMVENDLLEKKVDITLKSLTKSEACTYFQVKCIREFLQSFFDDLKKVMKMVLFNIIHKPEVE